MIDFLNLGSDEKLTLSGGAFLMSLSDRNLARSALFSGKARKFDHLAGSGMSCPSITCLTGCVDLVCHFLVVVLIDCS